jgi:hypothetical protein
VQVAKSKTDEETATQDGQVTALETVKANVIGLFGIDTLAAIQQEYGVTPADVSAPMPLTPTKENLDQLCSQKSAVYNANGNLFEGINGHSGPLMFLEKKGEYDGDKFTGYDGFYVYAIAVPGKGEIVITIGRPVGEKKPAIVVHMDNLSKGQLFQVASFATSKGFRVFNPIPVQQDGKLIQ